MSFSNNLCLSFKKKLFSNSFDNDYYFKLNDSINYSEIELKFCLITDESFGYKGVKINDVRVLSGTSEFIPYTELLEA